MAVSKAMRRLLRIRDLEEEQHRVALENAEAELRTLVHFLEEAGTRAHRGRALIGTGIAADDGTSRMAGLIEAEAGQRFSRYLGPRVESAVEEAARKREVFLEKRVERRQAESLIEHAESTAAVETNRKGQQALDEWFRSRAYSQQLKQDRDERTLDSE